MRSNEHFVTSSSPGRNIALGASVDQAYHKLNEKAYFTDVGEETINESPQITMRDNRGSQILNRELLNVSKTMAGFMKSNKKLVADTSFDPKQGASFYALSSTNQGSSTTDRMLSSKPKKNASNIKQRQH